MTTKNQEPEQEPPLTQQKKPVKDVTEQFARVWELTMEAWAKKGVDITKQQMRKDITRVIRRKRDD